MNAIRIAGIMITMGFMAAVVGASCWIILCVEDGYTRQHATAQEVDATHVSAVNGAPYPFEASITTPKAFALAFVAIGSFLSIAGIALKNRASARLNTLKNLTRR